MKAEIKERIEKIKKGEVPEGYKKTKRGIIPLHWELNLLKNLVKRVRKPVKVETESQYKQIGIRSHGKGIFHKDEVSGFELGNKSVFWIEPECFIVNIVFAWEMAVAKTTYAENGMIASHRFPMYKPIMDKLDIDYLTYFFKSYMGKNLLELASPGGAGRNKTLGQNEFLELEIPISTEVLEQQKIATILSTWDQAINLKEKLIEQKKEHKRGLMKVLLTGEVRLPGFEGGWKELKLGKIGSFFKGKGISKSEVIDEGIPCIRYGEIYTTHNNFIKEFKSFIPRNVAIASERIYKGDILFAGSGETKEEIGKSVAYMNDNEAYAGGDIIIFRPKEGFSSLYLGYALDGENVKLQRRSLGQGQSVVHIYSKDLKEISLPVPSIGEQEKIAQVLQVADKEITLLQQELQALKLQKKGLMQLLLTGIVRVNS